MDRCNGEWLVCAKRVLCQNNFNIYVYCCNPCRYHYLRQKNNIILVGPTNCGKPFFLNPLEIVFKSFVNPANRKYPWVGLEECEVAYLNDFHWSSEIIWSDFLLLQTVHLSRPKNIYATDLCIWRDNSLPIFATRKSQIEYIGKYNARDDWESLWWFLDGKCLNSTIKFQSIMPKTFHPVLTALVFW